MNKKKAYELIKRKNHTKLYISANEKRKKDLGDTVTYVVNRNINFTNICKINCRFCSFSEEEGQELEIDEVLRKIENAKEKHDITEVCVQGGINPSLEQEYYLELVDEIKNNFDVHLHAFSPQEILHIKDGSVEKTLKKLKKRGLDSIPGTAAEILSDDIRSQICPKKLSSKQWIDLIKKAHEIGLKSTATIMYGHIESWENRINHFLELKKIQKETDGFTEIIPLPYIDNKGQKNTKLHEDLKVISLARIILGDHIKNVQASWVKLGIKGALEALYYGANDLGGTLIEENITKKDKEKIDPEEMRELIKKAGRIPKQRTTLYKEVQ